MPKEHMEYVLFINSLWLYVKIGYTITTRCLIRKDSLLTFFVGLLRKITTLFVIYLHHIDYLLFLIYSINHLIIVAMETIINVNLTR